MPEVVPAQKEAHVERSEIDNFIKAPDHSKSSNILLRAMFAGSGLMKTTRSFVLTKSVQAFLTLDLGLQRNAVTSTMCRQTHGKNMHYPEP